MPKISALPPMTTADGDDEAPIVDDSASTTKKFTLTILKEWLQSLVGWITTAMLGDNQVTGVKIPTGAILLGYSKPSANQTGITTTETDLTGMSATVTVPTGGRNILLQAIVPNGNSTGGSADQMRFYFKEGSTYLGTATFSPANSFGQEQNYMVLVPNASAGSHTYKVAVKRTNGTGSYNTNWTATSPDITEPVFLIWGL